MTGCAVGDHALLFYVALSRHKLTSDKGFELDYSRYSLLLLGIATF